MRTLLYAVALCAAATTAQAQVSDDVVRIGVLNDQSGTFADFSGPGAVEAARMAVEDFGGTVLGKPIEVVSADHQNRADIGLAIARRWYDQGGVDTIVDVPNSAVALAVQDLTRQRDKIALLSGPGTTELTGKQCSPNGFHWAFDTYALATGVASAMMKQGADSWYFVTADYAFGQSLEKNASDIITAAGGKILGSVKHPIDANDFSSYLLTAQASGAKVIGLSSTANGTVTLIKQAHEFGFDASKGQKIAALVMYLTDVHALGLQVAQGTLLEEAFYWDLNDETRAWSERYFKRMGRMPTSLQAAPYSAVMHYLKSIKEAGTDNSGPVIKAMRSLPINDFMTKNGTIREDGRVVRPMYLFQVKSPAESKRPWDYYTLVREVSAEESLPPLGRGCDLVTAAK